ncbi:MAG: hypothetical protein RLZZ251_64 [Actinomycetota bacterium]|jgi:carboxylesterase
MSLAHAPEGLLTDYRAEGSGTNKEVGVLLLHGFTGSPASMRPWAEYLNQRGYTVSVPLIPGHGTRWEDLNKVSWQQWPAKAQQELDHLAEKCRSLFIFGLSMGGGNTLYVAAQNQGRISGLVLVNPMIHIPEFAIKFVDVIKHLQAKRPSVGDDIKKPGVTEYSYDALPVKGVAQLHKFLKRTRPLLPTITTPLQLFHSTDDHILKVSNTEIVISEIGSTDKTRIELDNSYHVATLDYDAEKIFENSLLFIEKHRK